MKKATYSRASTDIDFENVYTNNSFLYVDYNYTPSTTLDIEVGWALSQNDELKKVIAYKPLTIDCRDLQPGYLRSYSGPNPINFGADLADGNYKLLQIYRYQGESDWKVASYTQCIYAQIAGKQLSVRGYEDLASYTVNSIDYSGEMAEGSEVKVAVNVTNTCDAMQETAYFWIKQDGTWRLMGQGIGSYEPGQTGDINLFFTPDTSGTFDVKITTDTKGENVMGISTVTIYAVVKTERNGLLFACNQGSKLAKILGNEYSTYGWETLEIPSTINLNGTVYNVTRIDNNAFYNVNSLKKVVLPEGLQNIGNYAFAYCFGLKEIHLPSTLKAIGDRAFYGCSNLKTVVSYMKEPCAIDRSVFCVYGTLSDVFTTATLYVPSGSKSNYLSATVWSEFQKIYQGELKETTLDGITYSYATGEDIATITSCDEDDINGENLVIPSTIKIEAKTYQVKEIGGAAFWNVNSLQKVVLPEGLQYIGNEAFNYCYGLKEIHLPSTLKAIGDRAFYTCSNLETVVSHMKEPCAIDKSVFCVRQWSEDGTTDDVFTTATLYVPSGSKSNYVSAPVWSEFQKIYQGELKETTLDGITYSYATGEDFATLISCDKDYLNGKDLVIPSTIKIEGKAYQVKVIGGAAFWNVNSLQKVVLPEGLQYIGNYAFQYCYELKEIYLPSTLKAIGDYAFYGCSDLETVVSQMTEPCAIDRSVFCVEKWIDYGTWIDIFTTATLSVPSGAKDNYLKADVWNEFSVINIILLSGDANNDGIIDLSDLVLSINLIMDGGLPYDERIDMNHDGEINVADIILIKRAILYGNNSRAKVRSNRVANTMVPLSDFTAMQFEITVSDNMMMNDLSLLGDNKATHKIDYHQIGDNTYRVIVYSMTNHLFEPINGKIFELRSNYDENDFTISDFILVKPSGEKAELDVWPFFISTDIEGILSSDGIATYNVYDMKGVKVLSAGESLKGLKRGMYIINRKKIGIK